MSNTQSVIRQPRVLFFGMDGFFSYASLHALLERKIEVSAVIIPAQHPQGAISRREPPFKTRSVIPMLNTTLQKNILQLAWEYQIPIWDVYRLADPQSIQILSAYQADMFCVACFSQRIPKCIIELPSLGCLNVHPSLLPANRGPVPLFWTFYEGREQTGVTIHLLDEGMDTGDILAQTMLKLPDGISYEHLEAQCASLGGGLLAQTVLDIYHGLAVRHPQDQNRASYQSFPEERDFSITASLWTARHIYNFVRGVAQWDGPITLKLEDESLTVVEAISYSHEDIADLDQTVDVDTRWIRCKEGWVKIKYIKQETSA